jgi:hypothetical protein
MLIKINLEKARAIKRNKIAEEAKNTLNKLTQDFILALQTGDTELQTEISNKTKSLMNAHKDKKIDKINDLEELKNYIPDSLNQ